MHEANYLAKEDILRIAYWLSELVLAHHGPQLRGLMFTTVFVLVITAVSLCITIASVIITVKANRIMRGLR